MKRAGRSLCILTLAIIGCLAAATAAYTEENRSLEGEGVWSKSTFEKVADTACRRVFTCGPAGAVVLLADEKITFSAPVATDGKCRLASDMNCKACDAPKPEIACKWKIEKTPN